MCYIYILLAVNSDQFQILQSYTPYSSHPFFCALESRYEADLPVKEEGMYYSTFYHLVFDSMQPYWNGRTVGGLGMRRLKWYTIILCRILQGEGSSMKIIDSLIETFNMIKSNFPNFADKPIFNE